MSEGFVGALEARLRAAGPGWSNAAIRSVEDLTAGWESLMSIVHLSAAPIERAVLRRYPGRDGSWKSQREAAGMHALHAAGYPVPEVYVAEPDEAAIGLPFLVIEHVPGELLPMDAEELARLLALLHDLDPSTTAIALGEELPHGHDASRGLLARWRAAAEAHPGTGLDPVLDWLDIHLDSVPVVPPSVVHLDFHPRNVLVHPVRGPTVIDWTQVAISDPRHDLAWTMLLVTAYEGPETAAELRSHYERRRGPVQGPTWFDAAAAAKRLFTVVVSITAGPDAMGMNPDSVATIASDPSHAVVYDQLMDRTGITVPEIETALGYR